MYYECCDDLKIFINKKFTKSKGSDSYFSKMRSLDCDTENTAKRTKDSESETAHSRTGLYNQPKER